MVNKHRIAYRLNALEIILRVSTILHMYHSLGSQNILTRISHQLSIPEKEYRAEKKGW